MDGQKKSGPLYSIIYEKLREAIVEKRYVVGQKLPTEVELAKEFGVSRITSKRALEELERGGYIYRQRGRGSFVSELPDHAREEIVAPRGVATDRVIPIVLPSQGHGMFGYVQGAADVLNQAGYYLQIYTTNGTAPADRNLLERLHEIGMRMMIYYPADDRNLDLLLSLHFNGRPIITIDKRLEGLPTTAVISDNRAGGRMVTEMLLNAGHRRIAYVASVGIEAVSSVRDRYIGYCTALSSYGVNIDPRIVSFDFTAPNEWGGGLNKRALNTLRSLLDAGVTAVQAEHDFVAREVMLCAEALGLSLPEELSIVGFDNAELGAHLNVPLTTVEQNFYEIGRLAAQAAVRSIEDNTPPPDQSVVVPVRIISRASVSTPARRENGKESD
ncbi:MAG: GntR family transcriptional regulator [Alicyclobacillus sp.]|nr:GntR family transcriptional regulator [Alicyclobacillus sp.]